MTNSRRAASCAHVPCMRSPTCCWGRQEAGQLLPRGRSSSSKHKYAPSSCARQVRLWPTWRSHYLAPWCWLCHCCTVSSVLSTLDSRGSCMAVVLPMLLCYMLGAKDPGATIPGLPKHATVCLFSIAEGSLPGLCHCQRASCMQEARARRKRVAAALAGAGMRVVIDCQFAQSVPDRELRSLCKQIQMCLPLNKAAAKPVALTLTGFTGGYSCKQSSRLWHLAVSDIVRQ